MRPWQQIEIQLVDKAGDPVRIQNILLQVKLFYPGTNQQRYIFLTEPTDAAGHVTVLFSDLDERRIVLGFGDLMDYSTPLTECDPVVEISIPSEEDFQERKWRVLSRSSWWRPTWLMEWPANGQLIPGESKLVKLEGQRTHVDIIVRLREVPL